MKHGIDLKANRGKAGGKKKIPYTITNVNNSILAGARIQKMEYFRTTPF
jgi:hypothetical protein